jgi:hypothetical protein
MELEMIGRPGKPAAEDRVIFNVTLPQRVVEEIDRVAASEMLSRAAWARRVLVRAMQEATAHG